MAIYFVTYMRERSVGVKFYRGDEGSFGIKKKMFGWEIRWEREIVVDWAYIIGEGDRCRLGIYKERNRCRLGEYEGRRK